MDIRKYQKADTRKLFDYWKRVGTSLPYFFPVSAERWQSCLLDDKLSGERLFERVETYLAIIDEQVVGFVQYGQPHFVWDANGQRIYAPRIGVIRHLYFEESRDEVGTALLQQATRGMAGLGQQYAFYHMLGMSCNAHHGKLHISQGHIERLLLGHGFRVEHENVYYVLDMKQMPTRSKPRLRLSRTPAEGGETRFVVGLDAEIVGSAQVRHVDRLTGGYTRDTAYMTWIGVEKPYQGQGIGTELVMLLVECLLREGYRYLHTDTASVNIRAQQFYGKLGFEEAGRTRSYIRA